ncbi:MAG: hypothetical protein AAGA55_10010 [Planctomycetota bacterium]
MRDAIDAYRDAQTSARDANETRYEELKTGMDDLQDRVMGRLDEDSLQSERDIMQRYSNDRSALGQSLVSSGLSGSTIRPSLEQGIRRQEEAALSRDRDARINRRNQYDTDISKSKFGVIERRNDIAPDQRDLAGLFAQYAQLMGLPNIF